MDVQSGESAQWQQDGPKDPGGFPGETTDFTRIEAVKLVI